MTAVPAGVVVVDLDGTLVLGNSFHEFLGGLWRDGGLATRRSLLSIAILRTLSRGQRARQVMKLRVLKLYAGLDSTRADAVITSTVDACLAQVSAPVLALVRSRAETGWTVMIASAAPAAYADVLSARLGFDTCLATSMAARAAEDEMFGERKAAAVRAWLSERTATNAPGSVPLLVVTDHQDDLPLMWLADEVVLQGSAEERVAIEGQLRQPAAFNIDPLEEQSSGGLWLWFDDRPSGPHDTWELTTILSKHRYALLYTGAGSWQRVLPGSSLSAGVRRLSCPRPPTPKQRVGIAIRRRVVRDRLGIFH